MNIQSISKHSSDNKIVKLFYIFLCLIPFLFIGCEGCSFFSKNMPPNKDTPDKVKTSLVSDPLKHDHHVNADAWHVSQNPSAPASLQNSRDNTNPSDVVLTQPPIFFLAHGLSDTSDCFKFLEQELPKKFPGASVILSNSVTSETCSLPIEKQIEKCHKEFLEGISNIPHAKTRPIVLAGHSQGGLRMAGLAFKLVDEGYKVKLITINTPFEGVPLLRFEGRDSLCEYINNKIPLLLPLLIKEVLSRLIDKFLTMLL